MERFDTLFFAANTCSTYCVFLYSCALRVSVSCWTWTVLALYCFSAITRHLCKHKEQPCHFQLCSFLAPPDKCACLFDTSIHMPLSPLCLLVYTEHNNATMKGSGICLMLQLSLGQLQLCIIWCYACLFESWCACEYACVCLCVYIHHPADESWGGWDTKPWLGPQACEEDLPVATAGVLQPLTHCSWHYPCAEQLSLSFKGGIHFNAAAPVL